ncbi:uncharacterized protein LOC103460922 [Poecilia reticulata]|uniref:uncharacterized protein LOC103460922 n=1 Tax=Poecilia reticulata TaxID=8081 RepID=UPI0004A223CE|nr:PREDICTED: uncharacterized protein LOC103460922 [Poecilia reticulata]
MAHRKKRKMSESSSVSEEATCSFIEDSSQLSGTDLVAPSVASMKSDSSKDEGIFFRLGETPRSELSGTDLPTPSVASMKSDSSKDEGIFFGPGKTQRSQLSGTGLPAPSIVSMKSDSSKDEGIFFRLGETEREQSYCYICEEILKDSVQFGCRHWACSRCAESALDQSASTLKEICPKCEKKPKKAHDEDQVLRVKKNLQKIMHKKFSFTSEGNGDQQSSLKDIYTILYITIGENKELSEEHEFRHLKGSRQTQPSLDSSVKLTDIFKPLSDQDKPNRTVVTKGVAGIGKSYSVQKFILDWAEEEANKDVDFVFCLTFRELNLVTRQKSLNDLLVEFRMLD